MATTSDNIAPRTAPADVSISAPIPPLSPANTLFSGSAPTSPATQPDADCCVVLGENVSEGFMPCPEHTGRRRRTIFGITLPGLRSQKALDPFDYEQKYTEAEPYKEMGDGGRIWKTYVEESIKVDANQVADWTDALDVLLVFAGLFSAVVSSFVSQTYQSLLIDHSEVTSYLTYESVNLQRAKDANISLSTIPRSELSPNSTSDPSLTAVCVNGLWFTSLTLSLTTALIAVLTKQWIHQYMSFAQTGGPRERTQLRQARADNLEAWNVPVIIGLLPVMMHVALGVFLAGLIIFLRSLNNPIMGIVSAMAFIALCAYVASNLLPVFKASCPYVTPLTHYAYRLAFHVHRFHFKRTCRHSLTRVMQALRVSVHARSEDGSFDSHLTSSPPLYPPSLREAEKALVKTNVTVLEAKAASWLLTGTSNSSVHRVVLHALSNVPLQSVSTIKQLVGQKTLEDFLDSALAAPEYSAVGQRAAYERLTRARILLCPTATFMSAPSVQDFFEDFLPCLLSGYHRPRITEFLRRELLQPSARLDVASWTKILQTALGAGADWLDIGSETSPVWQEFLTCLLQEHTCPACAQRRGSVGEVYSMRCIVNMTRHQIFDMAIVLDPLLARTTIEPISFRRALGHFLIPSLSHMVHTLAYPSLCTGEYYDIIPSDIRLRLAMLESSAIRRTSFTDDEDEITLFAQVVECVQESIGINARQDAPYLHHRDILRATFLSVLKVVDETFQAETLCSQDRKHVLHILFRILVLDSELRKDYGSWITDERAATIMSALFAEPGDFIVDGQLIADTLEAVVRTECAVLLSKLYPELCRRDWLKDISDKWFDNDSFYSEPQTQNAHYFAAAVFIRGISIILAQEARGPSAIGTLEYIRQPKTLLTLCKLLVLADVETRKQLAQLYPLISEQLWMSCFVEIRKFLRSPRTAALYAYQLEHRPPHPYEPQTKTLIYDPFQKLFSEFLSLTGASSRDRYPSLMSFCLHLPGGFVRRP